MQWKVSDLSVLRTHSGAAQMEWPNPLGCGPAYSAAACNAAAAAAAARRT